MNEHKAIVGTVSWADTGETMTFTDANEYLECIKENIEYMGIIGFKFRTLTRDPAVRKAVDDILYGEAGEEKAIPAGDQDYIKGIMVGLTKAAQKYEQKEEQKQ